MVDLELVYIIIITSEQPSHHQRNAMTSMYIGIAAGPAGPAMAEPLFLVKKVASYVQIYYLTHTKWRTIRTP